MKKQTRLIAFLLVLAMLFAFASCSEESSSGGADGEVLLTFGEYTLSEKDYMYILSMFKSQMIDYYQAYFSQYGVSYSESDILSMKMDEDTTFAQYIEEISLEFAQQMLVFEKLCGDAGISITNKADIDQINEYMEDLQYSYGGEDLFEIELARLGLSRYSIERYLRSEFFYSLIREYRYGENGIAQIPAEKVHDKFMKEYLRYDGALFAYVDYNTGTEYSFEYTDDEARAFFDTDFVKVRHILYKTVDSSNKKLSDEKVAQKKSKAEATLNAIKNDGKKLDDFKSDTEDSGYEYVFTRGKMVANFEKAAFEMEVGEVRLVETEYGFHIIEKLEKSDEDFSGKVGEDGKTTGGNKANVIKAMTAKQIRSEALVLLEKLQSGEVQSYPEKDTEKAYYIPLESNFIKKDDTNYAAFIEMLDKIEEGKYAEKNFVGDATYVIRRLPMTAKDITASIYQTIEDELTMTEFSEYVQSFYDQIEIDEELLAKFDVVTIPKLDGQLYTFG